MKREREEEEEEQKQTGSPPPSLRSAEDYRNKTILAPMVRVVRFPNK